MKEGNDGFVRADQIDLKSLDEQLERHLSRALTLEKNRKRDEEDSAAIGASASSSPVAINGGFVGQQRKQRLEWEIDPSKLIIKTVLARGTFGTVHRGIYDGQDVAGESPTRRFILSLSHPIFFPFFFLLYGLVTVKFSVKSPIFRIDSSISKSLQD